MRGLATVLGVACVLLCAPISHADGLVLEAGPTFASSKASDSIMFALRQEWNDWAIEFGAMDEQTANVCSRPDCKIPVDAVLFIGAEREFDITRRLSVSVGPYYFNRKNRISSANLNARLAIHVQVTNRLGIRISHFSNFGSGEDIVMTDTNGEPVLGPCREVGTKKYSRCEQVPILNDFNIGYDALLLTWRF